MESESGHSPAGLPNWSARGLEGLILHVLEYMLSKLVIIITNMGRYFILVPFSLALSLQ